MLQDIKDRIKNDFEFADAIEVEKIFNQIASFGSNTGVDQVLRSILYLSNGDLANVKKYYSMYCDDPRDVIGEAEEKAGNPGHWFSIPFDQMDGFSGNLSKGEEDKKEDNLPF